MKYNLYRFKIKLDIKLDVATWQRRTQSVKTTFNTLIIKLEKVKINQRHLCVNHTMTFKPFCGHLEAVCYRLFLQLKFLPTSCDWNQQHIKEAAVATMVRPDIVNQPVMMELAQAWTLLALKLSLLHWLQLPSKVQDQPSECVFKRADYHYEDTRRSLLPSTNRKSLGNTKQKEGT